MFIIKEPIPLELTWIEYALIFSILDTGRSPFQCINEYQPLLILQQGLLPYTQAHHQQFLPTSLRPGWNI